MYYTIRTSKALKTKKKTMQEFLLPVFPNDPTLCPVQKLKASTIARGLYTIWKSQKLCIFKARSVCGISGYSSLYNRCNNK